MTVYKKLYWAETHSQTRKGFVIALSTREARALYAKHNGTFASHVDVSRVRRLPPELQNTEEIIPSDKTIEKAGIEVVDLKSNNKHATVARRMFNKHPGKVYMLFGGPSILAFQEINEL